MRSRRVGLLFAILLSCALAACGDDDDDTPPGPDAGADAGCTPLTLAARPDLQLNVFGQLTGVRYELAAPVAGAAPDALVIELYDSTTPDLPPLVAGVFDLADAPDDNLGTCQHCVSLRVDETDGTPARWFFQSEGTMTVSAVEDPLSYVFAGHVDAVTLREVTLGDDGRSTPVPGGACYSVANVGFDTTPTPGASCGAATDCGNPALEVCDPRTETCAATQCGEFQAGCPDASDLCVTQTPYAVGGACYVSCKPFEVGACDEGHECVQLGVSQTQGLCERRGDAAVGEACTYADVVTGCVAGATCGATSGVCEAQCPFFSEAPGCAEGSSCSLFGRCVAPALADPAAIGGTCAGEVELAHGCADDGDAFRGICFSFFEDEPMECQRACLTEASCAREEFCALRFSSGLGVCRPDPVCGDGELGEVGELCDDGNTESDDGCSGDCQTVEYGPLCAALPTLALDATVSGSTVHGLDGFMSSCQFGISRAALYGVDVPGPGRLTLTMTSASDHGLSLRGSCGEEPDELACQEHANAGGTEVLVAQITDEGPSSVVAMVSAVTILELGGFSLSTAFVAEDCGDGIVAGRELCDDGNEAGADGCSADCRRVEYEVFCAQAPTLAAGATVTGDTSTAVPLYDGSCESEFGTGPDRLYRFTAPSAGTLTVRLEQGAADLGLYVLSSCDLPGVATELDCSSVYDVEEVIVPLAGAQTVTIVVDGFRADQAGPYTLHTIFE